MIPREDLFFSLNLSFLIFSSLISVFLPSLFKCTSWLIKDASERYDLTSFMPTFGMNVQFWSCSCKPFKNNSCFCFSLIAASSWSLLKNCCCSKGSFFKGDSFFLLLTNYSYFLPSFILFYASVSIFPVIGFQIFFICKFGWVDYYLNI